MSSCLRALRAWSGTALFGSLLLLAIASPSSALTITIDASDSGWFSDTGAHTASNQSYATGWTGSSELRNFFVFDVSGLPAGETILSATLRVHNPEAGVPTAAWTNGYASPEASEIYELHEVLLLTAAPPDLVGNTLIYGDLGDGALFGSHTASAADNGSDVDIALTNDGIAALAANLTGTFVLGGLLTPLGHSGELVEEIFFGNTDPPGTGPGLGPQTRQLIVVLTPEPGTGLLLALGLIATGSSRRSRASAGRTR